MRLWGYIGVVLGVLGGAALAGTGDGLRASVRVHPDVWRQLGERPSPVKVWVMFTDKGPLAPAARAAAFSQLETTYSPRAIERRRLRRTASGLFDERDRPVQPGYMDAVRRAGASLDVTSRWLNAVSATATREQVEGIAALPFVKSIQLVGRGTRIEPIGPDQEAAATASPQTGPQNVLSAAGLNYGSSLAQLTQINAVALHNLGYSGSGVVLAVLDTGFYKAHESIQPERIIAEWDFVKNDANTQNEAGDPAGQHDHGTKVVSVAAGRKDGTLYGPAYEAALILCKTEDTSQEVPIEEDWFVAGLEFAESHGADVVTSSLGYIDWYTQANLDGQTAVTTVGVNVATANGVVCCNAAGNSGGPGPHLIAPADAFQVITVGAVDSAGTMAGFSSYGPTADGRVKPEVVARGVSTWGASTGGPASYSNGSGTSFATPLVGGVVACLLQAHPHWTVDRVRTALFQTADYYVAHGTFDPSYARGYGLVDALAASRMPSILGALSRKSHGAAGDFDLDVATTTAVEGRSGGPGKVVVTFDQPIQQTHGTPDDVHLSTGAVTALAINGSQLAIEMMNTANAAPLTVQFVGIANASDSHALVADTLCFRVLAGDANADGSVNVFDLVHVRNELNATVAAGNFTEDVNADGAINIFDLVAVRNSLNTSATSCP